jgi:hypothetical protein
VVIVHTVEDEIMRRVRPVVLNPEQRMALERLSRQRSLATVWSITA